MKNTLYSHVSKITIGIDRLDISAPAALHAQFIDRLYKDGTDYTYRYTKKYSYTKCKMFGARVAVFKYTFDKSKSAKSTSDKSNIYKKDRMYIRLFNPNTELMLYMKNTLISLSKFNGKPISDIVIKQAEIKYDYHGSCINNEENENVENIRKYLDRHLVMKYSRFNSVVYFKGTKYIGRNGNVRKGKIGIRSYVKNNKYTGGTFYRQEFQYNASYFSKKKITINDLPFNPLSFESYKHIDLWDDLSQNGLKNIATAVLKVEHPDVNSKRNISNKILREKAQELTYLITNKANNQRRSVFEQFTAIKDLKSRYKFKMNQKDFFTPLDEAKQLILCHADVSYSEDLCSKRMVLCCL